MPDDAGYSSSISGDRPEEAERIQRLIESYDPIEPLWLDKPTPEGPLITAPWPGLFEAMSEYPPPEDRGHAVMSELGAVHYVDDLIRPGRILVHAATEGSGKSYAEAELGIRVAVAGGAFAETWEVLRNGPVLVLSEMHEDDDYIREDMVLRSLGHTREDLVGRYYRLPLLTAAGGPPCLTVAGWRDYITEWLREHEALLLIVDTATAASQVEPWGKEMQGLYAGLRMMLEAYPELAIVLVVHLKKPAVGSGGKRDISAVMGEWGRWCDVVLLQENEGDSLERARLTTLKRVNTQRRISVTKSDGLLVDAQEVEATTPGSHIPVDQLVALIEETPGITYADLMERLKKTKDTVIRWVNQGLGGRVEKRQEGPKRTVHLYLTVAPSDTVRQAHRTEDRTTVQEDRTTVAPLYIGATVGRTTVDATGWLRPCRRYVEHLDHHRQTPEGWVCIACDAEQAAA